MATAISVPPNASSGRCPECYHDIVVQLTLRLPDQLVARVKEAARARSYSVNRWATLVLSAAVDPDLAADSFERTRERLAMAGLLEVDDDPRPRPRPDRALLAEARAAGSRGTPASQLISEDRG
jgi:hypothetical protein